MTVNWMYPDILNLYGDRGNLAALRRVGAQMGCEVVVRRVGRATDATPADLTFWGSGDLDALTVIAADAGLDRSVSIGGRVLVIGTTLALFARRTTRCRAPSFEGCALVPADLVERPLTLPSVAHPAGDDLVLESPQWSDGGPLVGAYVASVDVHLDAGVQPFAVVTYGRDNSGTVAHGGADGAVVGPLLWTNLLGPALVRNPWLAAALLRAATDEELGAPDLTAWAWERAGRDATVAFVRRKAARAG